MTYSIGSTPISIASGDFNNDNLLDVDTNTLGIFLGYGNGPFVSVTLASLGYGSRPFSVLVGDFNNDRKLDFAVTNGSTNSLSILLQTS
ncbi:unnamed protein product [Rotaria socialis]|uniref:VCBS repeat-containing protein n=1 Tax=Rotaria socialis TaxID=392032 RepID=A0A820BFZ2_9BILA|nr:unnamed protein product [Rotaria socialis]CAF3570926.1 unnamed protein product [Rotaria socialis]CAF4103364.1 unnamed protein product [Rotaria socialis]CAF4205581.1 unnamed protein product [Rotaria socialis]CAF4476642.1 unnamed protein product [Rotaria socialis]